MIEWLIPWWGWFIVGFALLLLELSSPGGFYFLFFGVGAIGVGALAWLAIVQEAWVQLTFFSIFSVVTSILFRRPLLARFGPKSGYGNVDSLVGEAATVIDNIEAGGFGKVELRGTAWNARNSSDRILVRGERCKVQRVDGLSLWVNKEQS
jgi:inner membrane protein